MGAVADTVVAPPVALLSIAIGDGTGGTGTDVAGYVSGTGTDVAEYVSVAIGLYPHP